MSGEIELAVWITFAMASAVAEAILYHKLYNPHNKNISQSPEQKALNHWRGLWEEDNWLKEIITNEHTWYVVARLLMWFPLFYNNLWDGVAAILCFPFFHDGMLYTFRNWLNPLIYRRGWWSEPSKGGTAMWDLSTGGRVTFFLLGVMLYVVFWVMSS
jgi:hypothetical protein